MKTISMFFFLSMVLWVCGCHGKEKVTPSDNSIHSTNLITNYWNEIDFNSSVMRDSDFIEQKFANFTQALILINDSAIRKEAAHNLMKKAETDTAIYRNFANLAYHYLYDPNSPFLDEESYIPFLEIFSESGFIDEAQRGRNKFLLEAALKNRPGNLAADFPYITREGENKTLYTTPVKGELLLIFYDPDCENCKKIISFLMEDSHLNEMISKNELTVLAIYSGEEKELWMETAHTLPSSWIVGYDPGVIDEEDSYYFRATPTLYLLDKEKKVIVKDLSPSLLINP